MKPFVVQRKRNYSCESVFTLWFLTEKALDVPFYTEKEGLLSKRADQPMSTEPLNYYVKRLKLSSNNGHLYIDRSTLLPFVDAQNAIATDDLTPPPRPLIETANDNPGFNSHSNAKMSSSITTHPSCPFSSDSTLPPKLDYNVGAKSHFFQPPPFQPSKPSSNLLPSRAEMPLRPLNESGINTLCRTLQLPFLQQTKLRRQHQSTMIFPT